MTMSRAGSFVARFAVFAGAIAVAVAMQMMVTLATGDAGLDSSYVVADGHGWIGSPQP